MVECGRFFEPSEIVCYDNYKDKPFIGIRAATFQRRRELMAACLFYLNEQFFQYWPIQIETENSSMFADTTLPFDYSSLSIDRPFEPNHWTGSFDPDCLVLDVWNSAEAASIILSADNYDRTKPYLQTLVDVRMSRFVQDDRNILRVTLHGGASATAKAVDYLARLHTFVKFRPMISLDFEQNNALEEENARKIPAMLIDTFRPFCERVDFEEWNDGTLWAIVRNCQPNLARNIYDLRRYMAHFYSNACVDYFDIKSSETKVIAAAKAAGVCIFEVKTSAKRISVFYAGLSNNIDCFLDAL